MPLDIGIAHGALIGAPIWSADRSARNWLAIIDKDPTAPNGLRRTFAAPAHGEEFYYLAPEWLRVGAAVEFGADVQRSRRVDRARWYGVVTQRSDTTVTLDQYPTAARAVGAAAARRREHDMQQETATGRALLTIEAALAALSEEQRAAIVALISDRHGLHAGR